MVTNKDNNITDKGLTDLLRSLPAGKPSGDLNARIMERVRGEKSHLEKRSERGGLLWAIVLSVVVLAGGIAALAAYAGWDFRSFFTAIREWDLSGQVSGLVKVPVTPERSGLLRTLIPFAVIVLLLLLGDSLLRRRFRARHERDKLTE